MVFFSNGTAGESEREVEDNVADFDDSGSEEDEQSPYRLGGYEYEFVDETSDNQKCPVCLLPMRDPVQTESCGHRLCRECLNGILMSGNPVCPTDRNRINRFFPDQAFAREMLCLRVKCERSTRGCDWIGQLRHAEDHNGECCYEDQSCLACHARVQRRLLEHHQNESCPRRIIECVYCQDEFTFIKKEEHEEVYCRRFPLVCPNSCGKEEIPREEMDRHLSETCPMSEVTCPFAKAGCLFQDKRAYLIEHLEGSIEDHLELTWASLAATDTELSACHDAILDLRQKFKKGEENNKKLTDLVTACCMSMEELQLKFQKSEKNNQELARSVVNYREQIRDLNMGMKELELQKILQDKKMDEMVRKNEQKERKIEELVRKINPLEKKMDEMFLKNNQLEKKIQDMVQKSIQQLERKVKDTVGKSTPQEKSLEEMDWKNNQKGKQLEKTLRENAQQDKRWLEKDITTQRERQWEDSIRFPKQWREREESVSKNIQQKKVWDEIIT